MAAIAWGALDCFFGYRLFKFTLALVGALLGVALGDAAAQALGLAQTGQLVAVVAGGVLGVALTFLLYLAAVFVTGFLFGLALGMLLLAHFHPMVAILSGCLLGVGGGFLALKLQRVLIILATALLGSFRALLALSYFTSRIDWLFYCRQPQQIPTLIDANPWMFPAILVLAAFGVIAQFEIGGAAGKKKKPAAKE